ncbi:RseC/MucC-like positive regulator of sigma(E) [Alkalispirillum mobile]|uniref:RseC/MucC-like positive regulator of sigma(E) n=1 Tax=Alkalispirillum mobile TaxID=85925 RepID=A0A498CD10_9GAMM|nr:SoxR reducing system RseC family protein [Alkalispirillum mobile]RLK50308.1 RseC/MucC-like positive regulator of sigma(E) [Alkalispirillum mobile]
MIEQEAMVLAREEGNAWVEVRRQSTCSGCAASAGCGTGALGRWLPGGTTRLRVVDPIGVQPGQRVLLAIPDGAVLRGSALLYLVPLLCLLVGALAGEQLSAGLGLNGDGLAILGGVLGLVAGFGAARRLGRRNPVDQPRLVRRCE